LTTLRHPLLRVGPATLALALPGLCAAHGSDAGVHHDALAALWAGFVHPLIGADHWTAMLAFGLWSSMTAKRAAVMPFAFTAMVMVGAMLGFKHAPVSVVDPVIACSLFVLGLLIAMRWTIPSWAGALMAEAFGLFHGAAHGFELAGPGQTFALAGMLVATLLLQGLGIALGRWLPQRAPWLPRLGGAALALFGTVLLGPFA